MERSIDCCALGGGLESLVDPSIDYFNRDRQEAGMALPLPNSAHQDQLISAKPRGTARFLSDLHM
jgi:hypothetical protein